jgi:hypothetical protein
MTATTTDVNELSDIKTHFYAIMEKYPAVYANHKANPQLPSAMNDYDKMESNLTALYRRMFAFQAGVEKELEQHETKTNESTNANVKLNAMLAKRSAKDALMPLNAIAADPPPSPNQISMVAEARNIEHAAYAYSIARIVYLVAGIAVVSYFVLQTVGRPDSTVLEDAKLKAAQLKNTLYAQPTTTQAAQPIQ